MKRLMMAVAGTAALLAGSATYAGGGCNYGNHSADADTQTPVLAAVDENDPALLAKTETDEETEALEKLLETPVVHN